MNTVKILTENEKYKKEPVMSMYGKNHYNIVKYLASN